MFYITCIHTPKTRHIPRIQMPDPGEALIAPLIFEQE
jgi:hypothetical protein